MEPYLLSPTPPIGRAGDTAASHAGTHGDAFGDGARTGVEDIYANTTWKPLFFLNIYRLGLSGLFVLLTYTGHLIKPLGSANPTLFGAIALAYLVLCTLAVLTNHWRRPSFRVQVYALVLVDIAGVIGLMHTSGGVSSGLGMLLVVTIAGGAILMAGRTAVSFAALASLAVLADTVYAQLALPGHTAAYPQAGLLGITFFATAILAHVLARRIRETEALAAQRGVDLANLAQLTEHIIQRMQTGVLVIDGMNQVRLMNEAAWHMLGMPATTERPSLNQLSGELLQRLNRWRREPEQPNTPIHLSSNTANILPRFARIGLDASSGTLIYLEDTAATAQQAQQMKLASLGGLTASIAHEIRNPLGAISHAGQLLAESGELAEHDHRLTQIITDHCRRINTIIENVQQLSRRDRSRPQILILGPYLEEFVREFVEAHGAAPEDIHLDVEPRELEVRFDPSQLQQILTNLCENALHHSAGCEGQPKVELRASDTVEFHRPVVEVIDRGPGISAEAAEHLFEPFFTTEAKGTGLGLYISRELAESNQAQLTHVPQPSGGACFRITFQDPRRQIA
ncbi:MAG TPA: ATP-binding protein [Gammaproteobacteria bacterium]|nr:ATP-binding protein [Gammaproteobacteria bacterium]